MVGGVGLARGGVLAGSLTLGCLWPNPDFDPHGPGQASTGSSGGSSSGTTSAGQSSTGATMTGGSGSDSIGSGTTDATTTGTTTDAPSCDVTNPCDADATCSVDGDQIACACNDGFVGDGYTCAVAPALETLRWEMPCLDQDCSDRACDTAMADAADEALLSGEPGTTYAVLLRIRGVVEEKTYLGGSSTGHFNAGGQPAGDNFNEMYLDISAPMQHYWLNAGASDHDYCTALDYEVSVPIEAGATVRIGVHDPNTCQIFNQDGPDGDPLVIPDIPPAPEWFDGQFLQLDAVKFTPA